MAHPHRPNAAGFTLIELMIVVALIAIIAAIAVPFLNAARISAHEGSAISSLRVLNSANEVHRARTGSYASNLNALNSAGLIDAQLGSSVKSGYTFTNYTGTATGWSIQADPTDPGRTGNRGFFLDESGVIRFSTSAGAGLADSALE